MVGKSSRSRNGARLAARAARPEVSTADVRRKSRRFTPLPGAGDSLDGGRGGGHINVRATSPSSQPGEADGGRELVSEEESWAGADCDNRRKSAF